MLVALSVGCLVCAVGLAGLSLRHAPRAARFEFWGGICLILGLALLGAALQGAR